MDPFTTPHHLWQEWERDLGREFLRLVKVRNLIDTVFGHQTRIRDYSIKTHNSSYSGLSWQNKSEILKDHLRKHRCDAMVRSSMFQMLVFPDKFCFILGRHIVDRNRVFTEPSRRRLSLCSRFQSLPRRESLGHDSLHKSNENYPRR